MNIERYTYYYFVGIGGIGMSAIARYFNQEGKRVIGYDKTPSKLTSELESEGISIIYEDSTTLLPPELSKENTLVIYTPAIKKLSILEYFKNTGFQVIKRSVALAQIAQESKCIAIAGTHGKTTTTTLLAYLLKECNFPMMAFLGGISENEGSNFLYNSKEYVVVEADEFDKSFHTLSPYYAGITSIDADHLDIYGDVSHFEQSFQEFADSVLEDGKLFLKKGLAITHPHLSYSAEELADFYAENIKIGSPFTSFDLYGPKGFIATYQTPLHGRHNIENATLALAMAIELEVDPQELQRALKKFKGIKRRFTATSFSNGKVYIDDYAHHPTELNAAIKTVNEMYPKQRKLFVFQPHLYSRTRDFAQDFAQSLQATDQLLLLDIYPAREEPIAGITSQWLASLIGGNVRVSSLENAMQALSIYDYDVLVTLGAGSIDRLSNAILKMMEDEA